jgi:gentisate 1,2-dioxygenase
MAQHVNETDRDAVWIDCLDVGFVSLLRTMFQEPHPAEEVKFFKSPVDGAILNPGTVAPPGREVKKLVYKWAEVLAVLNAMLPEDRSLFDGRCLEYRNPATGLPLPTFSCWIVTSCTINRQSNARLRIAVDLSSSGRLPFNQAGIFRHSPEMED